MGLLAQFRRRNAMERRLFFRALLLLAAIRLALWTLPFRLTQSWVKALGQPTRRRGRVHRRTVQRVAWAVGAAGRRVPKATCLAQAMATQVLLGRLGQQAELHLGVAHNQEGRLEAHAWLEAQGRVVKGGDVQGFHRFVRLERVPAQSAMPIEPG